MANLDPREVNRFDALADEWWSPDGPMAPLHRMNPCRLAYVREQVTSRFRIHVADRKPFTGLRMLDVGCGCGLLCEPLARLGASVSAIDPSERSIEVARRHAIGGGLQIDYQPLATDDLLARRPQPFDVVTCLEVIEHSPAGDILAQDLAELTRPGGLLIMSTLNRTGDSFLKAIVGAEYLLGWLPRGTHDWRRFVTPAELGKWLRDAGFRIVSVAGIRYDAISERFELSRERGVNYMLAAIRL